MKTRSLVCILLALLTVLSLLSSCKGEEEAGGVRMLSFAEAESVSEMEKLDGRTVSIIGYMSTLSPISGAFMYLMNLPYQSCPFCVPNTNQLSNTMAVYAKSAKGFEFTDRAILVTGTLEFGDFTDEFGYEYGYRIKDATYEILDTEDMSEELKLWQQLAASGVISDIYTMFEYVNFLCFWPTYTAEFSEGKDYLYPSDALHFIESEGAQFHYGFKEGYFDGIRNTILAVDGTAFAALVKVIDDAEALADTAYAELKAEQYGVTEEYSDTFGDGRTQYRMTKADELESGMEAVYRAFSEWLASWEM